MFVEISNIDNMVKITYNDTNETESYNKLRITSIGEFLSLYRAATTWYNVNNSDDIFAPYSGKLKEMLDKIKEKHCKKYLNTTEVDLSASFAASVSGESKLVYMPVHGVIKLARRGGKNVSSLNSLCITNLMREEFISDCKKINNIKYTIDRDAHRNLFDKWVKIIKTEYIRQYLKDVNNG